ncbi:hypothetical protein MY9_3851 [Bacillus sp. JS]|nr:hypothetical protein MY9_3851 [Bacillus sp. JS]
MKSQNGQRFWDFRHVQNPPFLLRKEDFLILQPDQLFL